MAKKLDRLEQRLKAARKREVKAERECERARRFFFKVCEEVRDLEEQVEMLKVPYPEKKPIKLPASKYEEITITRLSKVGASQTLLDQSIDISPFESSGLLREEAEKRMQVLSESPKSAHEHSFSYPIFKKGNPSLLQPDDYECKCGALASKTVGFKRNKG